MRENCGPGDMCGVQNRFNIDADGVQVLIVYDGGNNFVSEFLDDGGGGECIEMSRPKVGCSECPICGQPGSMQSRERRYGRP